MKETTTLFAIQRTDTPLPLYYTGWAVDSTAPAWSANSARLFTEASAAADTVRSLRVLEPACKMVQLEVGELR